MTEKVIRAALTVHRDLGRWRLESLYRNALAIVFDDERTRHEREFPINADYCGRLIGRYKTEAKFHIEVSRQSPGGPFRGRCHSVE